MTKYVFGVMSNKWEMEAEDFTQAYIAMSLWVKQNVPVAVYEPQTYGFMPKEILENNIEVVNPEMVKEIMKTIKEVE